MTGATRQNIFRLKRSNIPNKVPTTAQLLVGEMAVNTQDGYLWTSIADTGGTTTIEVRQIGWDRLSTISGGTVDGYVWFNSGITVYNTFTYPSGATAGYVLTSDSFGNASWQPVPVSSGSTGSTYTQIDNYTAATPVTITHNLNTTDVLVQIIDTNTNQLIGGLISNYTLNSVDVTLSTTINNVKVVVAGGLFVTGVDNYVTGGTYDNNTGTLTLNRQNGSVIISGFFTGGTGGFDTYVTGFTYNNANVLTISQNAYPDLSVTIDTMTGLTVNGSISATTYYGDGSNLTGISTVDNYVTGGTYSNGTLTLDRQNGSVTISGFFTGGTQQFTGGTGSCISNLYVQNLWNCDNNGITINNVNYIDFQLLTASPVHNEGRVHWIDDTKTISIDTEQTDVSIEVGHQNVTRVINNTGSVLQKGRIVYITGGSGGNPEVSLADYSTDPTSARSLGFVIEPIPASPNSAGYVITYGLLRGTVSSPLNTNAYPVGTQLYLYTGGTWTSTKPIAPLHEVRIGQVIRQNTNDGVIFVTVQNGYELNELHDVYYTTPNNGDILRWVSANTRWEATALPIDPDTYVTGFTYSNNNFVISQNNGQPNLSVTVNNMTGLTVNGTLSATTIQGDGSGITNVGLRTKSGQVVAGSFTGTPRKATVTFTTNFPSSNYSISAMGGDNRTFTYESKTVSGFTINANAAAALTQPVLWMAIQHGEY